MNPIPCRALTRLIVGASCALFPLAHAAAEPAKCSYTPIGKLALRYSGPGLAITTQGTINGTPAELLVDTGAYATVMTRTGTERRGLRLYDTGERATGIGGTSPIYATKVEEFTVGPIRAGLSSMPVLGTFGDSPSYEGILGAPALFQTDMELSLATKELTFFVPEKCGNTFLGYWGGNAQDIPLRRHNQHHMNPHFAVKINGVELEAMIDTGAVVSLISTDGARRAGIAYDTPDVKRGVDLVGVGSYTTSRWLATVKSFQIGDEVVQNADIAVENSGMGGADVTLGADFLRAHRVLFAMSQNKLYFSYVGGEPFSQGTKLEPWVVAEANGGNPDAQLALASAYSRGKGVTRDAELAASWLEKAAAGGNPHAMLRSGERMVARREYAAAIPRLRAALDKLPAERDAALTLYIARVKTGQAELAKAELAAAFARSEKNEWPKPVADFYLGTLPADKLLAQAADHDKGSKQGEERYCAALSSIGDWQRAHGQAEPARATDAQMKTSCADTGQSFASLGN